MTYPLNVPRRALRAAALVLVLGASTVACAAYQPVVVTQPIASVTQTLFGTRVPATAADPDAASVELGMRFRSSTAGTVSGVRFYKSWRNTGTHTGNLWSTTGQLLARATFTNETASGWQAVRFSQPVAVSANTTYVASYFAPRGGYAADEGFFARPTVSGTLTAPADGAYGRNSVYAYAGGSSFPTQSWNATNYWVDVMFASADTAPTTTAPVPTTAPVTTATTAPATTTTRPATTTTAPATTTTRPPTGGTASCALTMAAKGCWAANTGVPGYSTAQILAGQSPLRRQSGVLVVSTPGAVIDGIWLDGCIAVRATNVTIKNSYVRAVNAGSYDCTGGNRQAGASAINSGNGSGGIAAGLQIIDTEVDGQNTAGYSGGIADSNYTCTRCNVHGFTIQLWAGTNVVISESFVHDNNLNSGQNHSDGVMADSGVGVTLRHNWIAMDGGQDWITTAINIGGSWGPGRNLTLESNFLAGFSGSDIHSDPNGASVRVVNNALSNRNGWGGADFVSGAIPSSAVESGNYVPETGAALNL
jgi:hypothetical protein